jgi:two-component system OmpR family response regulator
MPRKVLVVEDDPALSDAIREGLSDEGIQADVVSNVRDAIDAVKTRKPDAVVLDLMLGNESGMDVLKSVRASRDQTPILILSALGATENRVAGLHEGADDYLVKPFEMKELHARLVGPLRMELTTRRAFRDNKELKLSPTEISLLELFIRHENQILTRKMLYHHLWDTNWESETNVIEVHINRLRSKVDKGFDKPLIHTLRGRGYILSETVPAHRETIETESDAENT